MLLGTWTVIRVQASIINCRSSMAANLKGLGFRV